MDTPFNLNRVRGAIQAAMSSKPTGPSKESKQARRPVVTVSRQAGTDAPVFVAQLTDLLNEQHDATPPWIYYDRDLVERVATDHGLEADIVERLDEQDKSWFEHFAAGITGSATGTDVAMKTAKTIRGLAWIGHAVIVGRGGQSVLSGLQHVIHVRLVAPIEWRAERYPETKGLPAKEAMSRLTEIDAKRAKYVKQHFGKDVGDPLLYDVTINMARTPINRATAAVAEMVRQIDPA